jgi:hypothetical protein
MYIYLQHNLTNALLYYRIGCYEAFMPLILWDKYINTNYVEIAGTDKKFNKYLCIPSHVHARFILDNLFFTNKSVTNKTQIFTSLNDKITVDNNYITIKHNDKLTEKIMTLNKTFEFLTEHSNLTRLLGFNNLYNIEITEISPTEFKIKLCGYELTLEYKLPAPESKDGTLFINGNECLKITDKNVTGFIKTFHFNFLNTLVYKDNNVYRVCLFNNITCKYDQVSENINISYNYFFDAQFNNKRNHTKGYEKNKVDFNKYIYIILSFTPNYKKIFINTFEEANLLLFSSLYFNQTMFLLEIFPLILSFYTVLIK